MPTQIHNLEQYKDVEIFSETKGFFRVLKIIATRKLYIISKDEKRPIEDVRRWRCGKMSSQDHRRTRFSVRRGCDIYSIPRKVAKTLDQPKTLHPGLRDRSGPPSYETLSEIPCLREREVRLEDATMEPAVAKHLVSLEPPMPPETDMPLPSLSTLHVELQELVDEHECFYLQMVAVEEALGGNLMQLDRERGESAKVGVEVALSELVIALEELQGVEWKEAPSEPMHRKYASDIGRELQDLRSIAGDLDKFLKHLRFLAFHSGVAAEPPVQISQGEERVQTLEFLTPSTCSRSARSLKEG